MTSVLQDLKYGLRMLARNPGFTAVAVITLALGIGANTAIFSQVDQAVLRWLPVPHPEQLVRLLRTLPRGGTDSDFSFPEFEHLRDRNQSFSGIFASDGNRLNATIDGQPEILQGKFVSGNYHAVMGISANAGRTFIPADDQTGKPPVAVISCGYWQRRFSHDPTVVGKRISLKRIPFTIVGVAPEVSRGWSPDILIPMAMHSELALKDHADVSITARLKPGVDERHAAAELSLIYQRSLEDSAGSALSDQRQREIASQRIVLLPAGRGGLPRFSLELRIMLAVVGLVLLIACANVANLLLGRATARQNEIAVRLAIGADRGRLIRQLLTESVLLALMGGALGLLAALWGGHVLWTLVSSHPTPISLDPRIFGFTAVVSLLTGVSFGLVPALRATRVDLTPALKENARSLGGLPANPSRSRFGVGKTLVVSQVALSLVVLIGAGLFLRSLQKLYHEEVGFNRENVLLMWTFPTLIGYEGPREVNLYRKLLERIDAVPGVHSASLSRLQLLTGYWESDATIPGYTPRPNEDLRVSLNTVAPRFFETMEIPLLLGRDFAPSDGSSAPRVAIISETMARQCFHGESPIGKRFALAEPINRREIEIVGVVKDIKSSLRQEQLSRPLRAVYIPFPQAPPVMLGQAVFEIRTAADPTEIAASLRREVRSVEKDLDIGDVGTQSEVVDEQLGGDRSLAKLTSLFGVVALLLASIGLYGTMSYSVSRRINEIGIRMALGAERKHVLDMVLREGLGLTLVGVAIGLVSALALTRVIASQLYGVSATDPMTFGVISLILILVALVACYVPARRATKVDPMVALRYE